MIGWARVRGMLNLTLLDVCAPGLAIGYAIGRIGCQLSGPLLPRSRPLWFS